MDTIKVTDLKNDDVIIIKVEGRLTKESRDLAKEQFEEIFKCKVIILEKGMEVEVIKKIQAEQREAENKEKNAASVNPATLDITMLANEIASVADYINKEINPRITHCLEKIQSYEQEHQVAASERQS